MCSPPLHHINYHPYIFEDGVVITGFIKSIIFEIDLVTRELIRNHMSTFLLSVLSNEELDSYKSKGIKDLMQSSAMNPIEPPLHQSN